MARARGGPRRPSLRRPRVGGGRPTGRGRGADRRRARRAPATRRRGKVLDARARLSRAGRGGRPGGGVLDPIFDPELGSHGRRGWNYDGIKRAVDLVGSLFFLVALSPLLALIAILVTLGSPGPVFFRQQRIGHMMKRFTMLKFRTMQVDADPKLHQEFVSRFIRSSGKVDAPGATLVKLTGDPRVTPIGRLLRKTSLDELPQLWNETGRAHV